MHRTESGEPNPPKPDAGFRHQGPTGELMDVERETVYVVIPAFNESRTIGEVIKKLNSLYSKIVVVDDGSSDSTATIAHQTGACVLRHIINRGQGAALQTGIEYSLRQGAEIVVTFDADGQHDADDITRLIAPIFDGDIDIVLGSRFLEPGNRVPWQRRIVLVGGIFFTRLASGSQLSDTHNGLRAFSRRAAETIEIRMDRMAHASELIDSVHRSGLPYCEVPVRVHYTEASLAKGQRNSGALRIVLDYFLGRLML